MLERKDNARLAIELATETKRADLYKDFMMKFAGALEDHAKRTEADAAKIIDLNKRIASLNDYASTPSVSGGSCFDSTDTDWVRSIWSEGGGSATDPASAPR